MFRTFVAAGLAVLALDTAQAESLWDATKSAADSAVSVVGNTVEDVGDAVSGDDESPATLRAKLDQAARSAIEQLTSQSAKAQERYERSYGYAVFDTRKLSILITTGFGSGVAVDKESSKRTYMKMATGGVNVGYGLQEYQVVFLFPDRSTFRDFVENGWSGGADASAGADQYTADSALQLENGVSVYKLDEKGVVLSATLTGTKYWRDADLN